MTKNEKLKKMWNDIDRMSEEELISELKVLHVTADLSELIKRLSQTYNDLAVADWVFETYPVDDTNSSYPKEFVDEAITKLARLHEFPFTHYGIISQDLQAAYDPMISQAQKIAKRQECIQRFLHMCKKFQLDYFDNVVYTVHDDLDMGKELLQYLNNLQKRNEKEDHRIVLQTIERFFQTFSMMNPWIEEQLQYEQAESLIKMKSSKGEKQFQQLLKQASDPTEALYHYMQSYPDDRKKQESLRKRYGSYIDKESEFYHKLKA